MSRASAVVLILVGMCGLLIVMVGAAWEPNRKPTENTPRQLPGVQPSGAILLPNQWSLHPTGRHLLLGDFPVNLALHPSGKYLAALHAGYGQHEIILVDIQNKMQRIVSRVSLPQTFYGLCFSPDGNTLYASGAEYEMVHRFAFAHGLLSNPRSVPVGKLTEKFIPAGISVDAENKNLFVAGTWGHAVRLVPIDEPAKRQSVALGADSYPYTCLAEPGGKRLFVSLWGKAAVAVVDIARAKLLTTWPTESHPTEMALSPDGKRLFVACSNSTRVSVLDAGNNGKSLETIVCALYPGAPSGNTPNSLTLTPDGQILVVANADNNNLAVFNVAEAGRTKSLGFIPVGWYPTSVRYNPADKRLYVANGKGLASKANPQGPGPNNRRGLPVYEYIATLFRGALSGFDLPNAAQMTEHTRQAYACSPLRGDLGVGADWPKGNPVPRKVGDASPIKHCIYIIKENRTYDQVFGDIKEGNGDPELCLFPQKVTPNHHKLAREFVLLDNFYVDGEVSADGHQWSMGAYATDFVEKLWPLNYRGSALGKLKEYPSEGKYGEIERPAGGYLWNRCAEAGVSYRSYGEWVDNGKKPGDPGIARDKALEGHFDPQFRGFDMDYPDVKRAERFLTELAGFERDGNLPRFIVLRLPNDHTSGTRVGKLTPRAYLADNDLALGMVIERLCKSKFWKETAVFVLEDDAQNGPDHVDAHRSPALVISPYTKRRVVDSTPYTTSGMVRTIELILGLKPMSQYDAAARPMYGAFQDKADLTAYKHVVPDVDRTETNKATAWGAKPSETFDLSKEDAVDDLLLNEVIWRSVKGPNSAMPAPVRAAFWVPQAKKDD